MTDNHVKISYILDATLYPYAIEGIALQKSWAPYNGIGDCSYWKATNFDTGEGLFFHTLNTDIDGYIGNPTIDADLRRPAMWMHIEAGNSLIQGVVMYRLTMDNNDNIRIIKRNGVDFKSDILTALSEKEGEIITENNLIGVAYLPMTDRLNV